MSSGIVRRAAGFDDNLQSQLEREFDRWRAAAEIIKRMREAGIDCELSGPQDRH